MQCVKSVPLAGAVTTYSVVLLVSLIAIQSGSSSRQTLESAALLFVILACCVSFGTILNHVRSWTHPFMQKHTVRMLLMVPIYSIESYLAIKADEEGNWVIIWETLRETYEAYAIYCFVRFMISGLAHQARFEASQPSSKTAPISENATPEEVVIGLLEQKAKGGEEHEHHMGGFQYCLRPWLMGEEFLVKVKLGTMSYVWTRLLCTLLTLILQPLKLYDEGNLTNVKAGYLWFTCLLTTSQTWALYVLVLFYHAMQKELQPLKPFLKFVSVKAVVFFSFWQSVVVAILARAGIILDKTTNSDEFDAKQIQDILICFEMFAAAVAMMVAFPASEHREARTDSAKQKPELSWNDPLGFLRESADIAKIGATIVSPEDVLAESEETASLLTAGVEVSGDIELGLTLRHIGGARLASVGVRVIQARNLAAGDVGGLSDPYVRLSLLGDRDAALQGGTAKTEVHAGTLNPVWDHTFFFEDNEVPGLEDFNAVQIEVIDQDFGALTGTSGIGDDSLGKCKIMKSAFRSAVEQEQVRWFTLSAGHNVYHALPGG